MLFLIAFPQSFSQSQEVEFNKVGISAGLGVSYHRAQDITDRLNSIVTRRVADFKAGVELFGAVCFPLSHEWILKLEHVYLLASYTQNTNFGNAEFSYQVHMPTLIGQYVLHQAAAYNFKLGAGAGYHLVSYSERYSSLDATFNGNGIGTLLELEANTALGEHLFAHIGTQLRLDFIGELTNASGRPSNNVSTTFHFFSAGVRLGMSYYF